jgi:hypothetical protein
LAQYNELGAERPDLMRDRSLDQREFDGLMESRLTESGTFIVDNGTSLVVAARWFASLSFKSLSTLRSARSDFSSRLESATGRSGAYRFNVRVNRDMLFELPYRPLAG